MNPLRVVTLLLATLVVAGGLYLGLQRVGRRVNAPLPDLSFAALVTAEPASPVIGESATLVALVENRGEGVFEGTLQVAAYTSDPREAGDVEPLTTGGFEGRIEPGELANVRFPYEAPDAPGRVELYFALNPEARVRELSRENNVLMSTIRVVEPSQPLPDLAIADVRFEPPAPRQNQDLLLVAVVENRGEASTQKPAIVDFYVNDPIGPRPRLPGIHRLQAPVLAPGESAEVAVRTRFEEPRLVGVHAQVNTDRDLIESNLANNVAGPAIVAVASAEQRGKADLVIESMVLDPPTPTVGSQGRLRVRLANRGGADTTSGFAVNVIFEPEGGLGPGFPSREEGEPSWSRDLRFLPAGGTYDLPVVRIPFVRIGTWTVRAEVDPYAEVDEGKDGGETNNVEEIRVRVGASR